MRTHTLTFFLLPSSSEDKIKSERGGRKCSCADARADCLGTAAAASHWTFRSDVHGRRHRSSLLAARSHLRVYTEKRKISFTSLSSS